MKKIAIFDFCNTCVNIDSADQFIGFSLRQQNYFFRFLIYRIIKSNIFKLFLRGLGFDHNLKFIILSLLKGIPIDQIKRSAKDFSDFLKSNHLNYKIQATIKKKIKDRFDILIISGGYFVYIDEFFKGIQVQVIANELETIDSIITGKIIDKDCMGVEKQNRFEKEFISNYDYNSSEVYSDDFSDMPLFQLAKKRYLVSNNPQLTLPDSFSLFHL